MPTDELAPYPNVYTVIGAFDIALEVLCSNNYTDIQINIAMTFYDLLYHTKLIVSRKSGHKCCRSITGDLWGSVGNMLPSCWYYKPY